MSTQAAPSLSLAPFGSERHEYTVKIDMSQRLAAYHLYINHDILNVEISLIKETEASKARRLSRFPARSASRQPL